MFLRIAFMILLFTGVAYAKDYTIVEVQGELILPQPEGNMRKYDVTTYKVMTDINDVEFTVIDKVERIDLHQLEYDIEQEQAKIDNANEVILASPAKITEINEKIDRIKALK